MSTSHAHARRAAGFTLIEVLITVVIVGILAMIALPSYSDYILRSKIIEGTTKLGDFRAQMEKYYLDNRTYLNGANCGIADPALTAGDVFQIQCTPVSATAYTVTATGQAAKGMNGFTMTIDQNGVKASSGPGGNYTNGACWAVRKDGSCQ
jgi:type IV pilus assembly protein PilE